MSVRGETGRGLESCKTTSSKAIGGKREEEKVTQRSTKQQGTLVRMGWFAQGKVGDGESVSVRKNAGQRPESCEKGGSKAGDEKDLDMASRVT